MASLGTSSAKAIGLVLAFDHLSHVCRHKRDQMTMFPLSTEPHFVSPSAVSRIHSVSIPSATKFMLLKDVISPFPEVGGCDP